MVGHDILLEVLPFELVAGIQNPVRRREILPGIDELAPVREAPDQVDGLRPLILPFQTLDERGHRVRRGHAVRGCFVVDLITDDRRVIAEVPRDLPDDALGVLLEMRVQQVLVLSRPVITGPL